jgi:hypothetical protein
MPMTRLYHISIHLDVYDMHSPPLTKPRAPRTVGSAVLALLWSERACEGQVMSELLQTCYCRGTYSITSCQGCFLIRPLPVVVLSKVGS